MKAILKKYYAYLRYLSYHETKDEKDPTVRLDTHLSLSANEDCLKEVFGLYVMNFEEDKLIKEEVGLRDTVMKGAYFLEIKKAYYQLIFDKQWCDEIYEIEQQHFNSMALIHAFSNKNKDNWFQENPLDKRQQDYGLDFDLPTSFNLSVELKN